MNYPHDKLAEQYARARAAWPFLDDVETHFSMPPCLLYAVGSRETSLRNVRGDRGHGWGVFQLDDRSHQIPAGYLDDVRQQAMDAAAHLVANYARYGDWTKALNAYNSGQSLTEHTAGGDYGPDVLERMRFLQTLDVPAPAPPPQQELEMPQITTDPNTGDFWVLTGPEGGVDARDVAGATNRRYYGNLIDHPEYNAGPGKPEGPAIGIAFWPQGQPPKDDSGQPTGPPGGYVIVTQDPAGGYHPYHFDATTLKG